jgi:hypothetical protein
MVFAPLNGHLEQALGNVDLKGLDPNSAYVVDFLRPTLLHHSELCRAGHYMQLCDCAVLKKFDRIYGTVPYYPLMY